MGKSRSPCSASLPLTDPGASTKDHATSSWPMSAYVLLSRVLFRNPESRLSLSCIAEWREARLAWVIAHHALALASLGSRRPRGAFIGSSRGPAKGRAVIGRVHILALGRHSCRRPRKYPPAG